MSLNKSVFLLVLLTILFFCRGFYLPEHVFDDKEDKSATQTGISN